MDLLNLNAIVIHSYNMIINIYLFNDQNESYMFNYILVASGC